MPDHRPSITAAIVRPLARFWWLPVLGLAIAVVAGVQVLDQLRPGWPPKRVGAKPATHSPTPPPFVDRPDHPFLATRTIESSAEGFTLRLSCPQTASGNRKCKY